jgi:hypothetical protein
MLPTPDASVQTSWITPQRGFSRLSQIAPCRGERLISGARHHHVFVPVHEIAPGVVHVVEAGHKRDHRAYLRLAADHIPSADAENDDLGEVVREVHQKMHRIAELDHADIQREYFREPQLLLQHSRDFRFADLGNEHVDARLAQHVDSRLHAPVDCCLHQRNEHELRRENDQRHERQQRLHVQHVRKSAEQGAGLQHEFGNHHAHETANGLRLGKDQRNFDALNVRVSALVRHRVDPRAGCEAQDAHGLFADPAAIDVHQQLDEALGQHDACVGDGKNEHRPEIAVENGSIEDPTLHLERRRRKDEYHDGQARNPELAPCAHTAHESEECRGHAASHERRGNVVGGRTPPGATQRIHDR